MRTVVKTDENGIVSLLAAFLTMLTLTLIVVGLAGIARREQREAINRQLSTQAFYAAESGVNDAEAAVKNGSITTDITTCASPSLPNKNLTTDGNIQYTCVLIDLDPPTVEFGSIDTDTKTLVPIDNTNLTSLTFSWHAKADPTDVFATQCPLLPPVSTWGLATGILRISLIPLDTLSRAALTSNTFTAYLYPQAGNCPGASGIPNGFLSYGASSGAAQGAIVGGNCSTSNTPRFCKVTIQNLPVTGRGFVLSLKSIYRGSTVSMCANACDGSTTIEGPQILVDATGKANGIVRRIQSRRSLSTTDSSLTPDYTLQTAESICKRLILTNVVQDDPLCPAL